ncbi:MAG: VanZ family protein [Roseovarius sp.]
MKITTGILITLVVACIIALGTLSPPGDETPLPLNDKQLHALSFALLVLSLGWLRPQWWLGLALAALLYGAAIEMLQPMVGRSGEWADLAADGAGIFLGLLPGQLRRRLVKA